MSKWRHNDYEDTRDYKGEAKNLINGLSTNQLSELYEIVLGKLKKACSDTRQCELEAVRDAIEGTKSASHHTLNRIKNGYRGQMAAGAKAKDGSTKPNRKKV